MSITLPIDKMSTTDRIQAMEDIWDSLIHEKEEIASPDWHEDILDSRREKLKSKDARFLTIKDLKNRLRK